MIDEARRCALPGCDLVLRTVVGRPERRYCSAAHRSAARQARRAAVQRRPVEASARVPEPALRPAVGGAATARSPRHDRARSRRPAVLGLVPSEGSPARPATAPGSTVPGIAPVDAWAQRAAATLASVERQLDTLALAADAWHDLPGRGAGAAPAAVVALGERRAELHRRRATLRSQLDAHRALRAVQEDVAVSEQHLRAVEGALADAPPPDRRRPDQEAAIAALGAQRDLRLRRRDTQRAALRTLEEGVASAVRAPLPDDGATTTRISAAVLDLVRDGARGSGAPRPGDGTSGSRSRDGRVRAAWRSRFRRWPPVP